MTSSYRTGPVQKLRLHSREQGSAGPTASDSLSSSRARGSGRSSTGYKDFHDLLILPGSPILYPQLIGGRMSKRRATWVLRMLMVSGLASCLFPISYGQQKSDSTASTRAFLDEYCVGCHNRTGRTAGLALDTLNPENVTEHP